MAFSSHRYRQRVIIREFNTLLLVLALPHIISYSKRKESSVPVLELLEHGSPMCNLKMCLLFFRAVLGWPQSSTVPFLSAFCMIAWEAFGGNADLKQILSPLGHEG